MCLWERHGLFCCFLHFFGGGEESFLFFTAVKKTFLECSNAFPESAACHFAFSASRVGARVLQAMMVVDTDVFCLDDENSL